MNDMEVFGFEIPKAPQAEVVNELPPTIQNGLASAVGLPGFPQNQGSWWTEQLSNSTTIFKNLRWYLVSNFRQMLSEAYVEIALIQTIIDVPVEDALRGGVEVKSKQLSEEQVQELLISVDRDDDLNTIGQGAKWNRLFGGGGVLIIVEDQDPMEPLDVSSITKDTGLVFRAVDMWELFYDKQNTEGYDPAIQSEDFEFYSYYGEKVHKTRVMRLTGLVAPSFIRPRLRGWGFSVVEALVRSINQYLKATDLSFEVLDEFKVDIYKIKNLTNLLMSPQGEQAVKRRVNIANYQKNYQNALVMDTEDDWDHKQLSFTGMAEVMKGIREQVASDMRIPMTKLFGISSAGFNSGEDDIENYNAMVEGQVRNKIKYPILQMLELKCQKLFGFVPDDLQVAFKPLRVLSAEQEETVKTQKFARLQALKEMGEIDSKEFREALNKGGLLDISLDIDAGLDGYDADTIGEDKEKNPEDGSDKIITQKAPGVQKTMPKDAPQGQKEKSADPKKTDAPKAKPVKNSPLFDLASYKADGGDSWIEPKRKPFFDNPKNLGLWKDSQEKARRAGWDKWQFVVWLYNKYGGTW